MRTCMKPQTFLLASALLCTLLGLGYPLSCEVCTGSGLTCSGNVQTCDPDQDSCVVTVADTSRKGHRSVNTYKGCMKSSACSSEFLSITMDPENYAVSNTRCCQGDACNRDPVPAPQNNRTENGLQCPTCIAHFKETCSSTQQVPCVGKESRCAAFTGKVQTGIIFATQGCATENACHTKPGTLVPSASRIYTITRANCPPDTQPSGKAK
ncbi:phospholipase A2 inhibitor and Ly6/PLAUR domain-containing protein-like [Hippopotamus amphibius kiboko]|uniref:phospholipase A2 inhibitor and Ly6/PLAUR domain-containing protein-like n=1 Tax=Hippopotamus amphibius kiboko TaxID=575201 RepID=UPI0025985431|nr:phospholipase A2 inhibitor and Ly6/PLAUR domain-containing protein-like [Hippopotamus amphibius kiboko]